MDRRTLGDYRIEGIVGAGRMGVVYLAIDPSGRKVALKVLRDDVAIDPVYRERFRREGRMLAALDHPHVIPIHGMGEIDGAALHRHPADLEHAARPHRRRARSPSTTPSRSSPRWPTRSTRPHAADVIHRDVKPANVLLDPGPRVYLTDFGLARDPSGFALTVPGPGARDDRLHGARAARGRAHRARPPTSTPWPAWPSRRSPARCRSRATTTRRRPTRTSWARRPACPSAGPSCRSPSTR